MPYIENNLVNNLIDCKYTEKLKNLAVPKSLLLKLKDKLSCEKKLSYKTDNYSVLADEKYFEHFLTNPPDESFKSSSSSKTSKTTKHKSSKKLKKTNSIKTKKKFSK